MPFDVIHILLLDSKVLCSDIKSSKSKALSEYLCVYLGLNSFGTFGLIYKDSRGIDRWFDESKLIEEHDIVPIGRVLHLILKIRFIPHHVCANENSIYQLILVARRVLRQNWFLSQPEIHSQLVALCVLSVCGARLRDSDIRAAVLRLNLSVADMITQENHFPIILNAYQIYRDKLDGPAEFSLKFLQLMMQFPIFNSKLFVVTDNNGEKVVLGVNSIQLTIFSLDQFHQPLRKIDLKNVDKVMHREIRIVVSLGNHRSTRSVLDNDMVTFFALSSHQRDCICFEIEACRKKYKSSTISLTVNHLMDDKDFKERFNNWIYSGFNQHNYLDYHDDNINIHPVESDDGDQFNNEKEFGEMKMYDSDIYHKISQATTNKDHLLRRPKPDGEQLSSEEMRLKEVLCKKMNELLENFNLEKELTGSMPVEFKNHFPSNNVISLRSSRLFYIGRPSSKGYGDEIKYNTINRDPWIRLRTSSNDNLSCHSSQHIKCSISPSGTSSRIKNCHSVSDFSRYPGVNNDRNKAESPLVSKNAQFNPKSKTDNHKHLYPTFINSVNWNS